MLSHEIEPWFRVRQDLIRRIKGLFLINRGGMGKKKVSSLQWLRDRTKARRFQLPQKEYHLCDNRYEAVCCLARNRTGGKGLKLRRRALGDSEIVRGSRNFPKSTDGAAC